MSTAPEAPAGRVAAPPAAGGVGQKFQSCWSCRLLSGGALFLSAGYVFSAARTTLQKRGVSSIGIVAQITFAACLASWGVVIITDPVGKSHLKNS
ncbi:hypothetical protein PBY51_005335 [Eleginops maclovinus]|uniref:Distal membrane-arm assembly complex protein 1-like domain-containing protein n=1 Tax=Eleginops maclovinus TaxID=56733 RepID=A0AAN8ACW1_ELEMC|nr:hypothetical protein PBY51_005335 [Eleginops maclovinus]